MLIARVSPETFSLSPSITEALGTSVICANLLFLGMCTLSMVYKGQREIGLVMALNFLGKITRPGPKGGPYLK